MQERRKPWKVRRRQDRGGAKEIPEADGTKPNQGKEGRQTEEINGTLKTTAEFANRKYCVRVPLVSIPETSDV